MSKILRGFEKMGIINKIKKVIFALLSVVVLGTLLVFIFNLDILIKSISITLTASLTVSAAFSVVFNSYTLNLNESINTKINTYITQQNNTINYNDSGDRKLDLNTDLADIIRKGKTLEDKLKNLKVSVIQSLNILRKPYKLEGGLVNIKAVNYNDIISKIKSISEGIFEIDIIFSPYTVSRYDDESKIKNYKYRVSAQNFVLNLMVDKRNFDEILMKTLNQEEYYFNDESNLEDLLHKIEFTLSTFSDKFYKIKIVE